MTVDCKHFVTRNRKKYLLVFYQVVRLSLQTSFLSRTVNIFAFYLLIFLFGSLECLSYIDDGWRSIQHWCDQCLPFIIFPTNVHAHPESRTSVTYKLTTFWSNETKFFRLQQDVHRMLFEQSLFKHSLNIIIPWISFCQAQAPNPLAPNPKTPKPRGLGLTLKSHGPPPHSRLHTTT